MRVAYERVIAHLDRLKLKRVAEVLDTISEQATKESLSYLDFLDRLLEAEAASRAERRLLAKTRLAHFPFHKTLADFDFSFQPSIDRKQIQELGTLRFLAHGENVIFLGPPGVGKTHCENHPAGLAWPTMLAMAAARMTRRSHWPVVGALALDMSPRQLSAPAWPPRVGLIRSLSASA